MIGSGCIYVMDKCLVGYVMEQAREDRIFQTSGDAPSGFVDLDDLNYPQSHLQIDTQADGTDHQYYVGRKAWLSGIILQVTHDRARPYPAIKIYVFLLLGGMEVWIRATLFDMNPRGLFIPKIVIMHDAKLEVP
jgi:hypothetical protein